jgi:hypothetical protein
VDACVDVLAFRTQVLETNGSARLWTKGLLIYHGVKRMFLVRKYRRDVPCNSSENERWAWELRDLETWSGRIDWGGLYVIKKGSWEGRTCTDLI